MARYVLKNRKGDQITYIYGSGYVSNVKVDYEKFLHDLMRYANVDIDEINTERDISALFNKARNRGFNFHKTQDGVRAIKRVVERQKTLYEETEYKRYSELKTELGKKKLKEKQKRKIRRKLYRLTIRQNKELTDNERKVLFESLN